MASGQVVFVTDLFHHGGGRPSCLAGQHAALVLVQVQFCLFVNGTAHLLIQRPVGGESSDMRRGRDQGRH